MQRLAQEAKRRGVERFLESIVAGVLKASNTLQVDRVELWELLDNLPVAILISTDRACTTIVGNKAAQAMLKVPHGLNLSQSAPPGELPSFRVYSDGKLIDPDDLPMQRAARLGQRIERSECEIRFDNGESLFIAGHCIPVQDEDGAVCGSLGAFVDVTDKQARHDKAELMAREMAHRVKNTVSLIQSMAHNTIKKSMDRAEFDRWRAGLSYRLVVHDNQTRCGDTIF